jgi:hypothetical protein
MGWNDTCRSNGKKKKSNAQVLVVFILSSSKNDVAIKITIELVIDHY